MNLIVFDIDGTLTNTKSIDDTCFINSIKECWNCKLQDVDWSMYKNVTDTGLAKDIYINYFKKEVQEEELLKLKEIFISKISSSLKNEPEAFNEIPGATKFFRLLQNKNVVLAFATGGWKETAEIKLRNININLSDFLYATSNDHFSRKAIVLQAIERAKERYNTTFKNVIYFGDGVWDYKVTHQLKMQFIGIDQNESVKLEKLGAKYVFKSFLETEQIFKVLESEEL